VPVATASNTSKGVVRVRDHVSLLTRSVQSIMAFAKYDFSNCALWQWRL